MKKYIFLIVIGLGLISCSSYQYDLDKMGEAVKSHLKYRDAENSTITKIEYIEPISYEKTADNERSNPDEVYLFKVYVKGTWAYQDSYRIFNISDTLKCYFGKNKTFLRMDENNQLYK
ncbi:hypothetical protein JGH11_06535 [Dysgonomonas sp. Marseille-P4677]|uniref:hypothetical protein n=1 Tax=Dysgonomonas sp. Marseille-P4677 TaxID=2364790 RepID=UPI00191416C2|nr:hypothetical protein [Dysgonomonas sp. Marseille-P4677]MBK5720524.1 hypothetical protein [Dysgonomonas sp. Marseille-P4677]